MNAFENEVRSLLSQGKKIAAVKLYKDQTGVSLRKAKEAVEALERSGDLPGGRPPAAAGSFEAELVSLLQRGQKIEAIKVYKERTGASLVEAKQAVEALESGGDLPSDGAPFGPR